MKMLTAAALTLALAGPALAQKPRAKAPVPASNADLGKRIFVSVDKSIADLGESVHRIQECVDAGAYLSADYAATQRRLKPKNGGSIPTNQAPLLVLKQSRMSLQKIGCVAQMKNLSMSFDNVIQSLSQVEPRSHPGIKPRREKVLAMREQYNSFAKRLGQKAPAASAEGSDAEPAE